MTRGVCFLGFLMALVGFAPMSASQPIPPLVWRGIAAAGAVVLAGTFPVYFSRREWARRSAGASLLVCGAALCVLLAFILTQRHVKPSNPFTLLVAFGVFGCGKGISFYRSSEIRQLFRP